jgi:3-dehydroquinate dehydratase-2
MSGVILLLSGPNLDQLGTRSPEIYGTTTLAEHVGRFRVSRRGGRIRVRDVQSNFEGDLIEAVRDASPRAIGDRDQRRCADAHILGPRDALATFEGVKVEVHLSNPAAREPYRHVSTLAGVVNGSIAGFGPLSYDLARRRAPFAQAS